MLHVLWKWIFEPLLMLSGTSKRSYKMEPSRFDYVMREIIDRKRVKLDCFDWSLITEREVKSIKFKTRALSDEFWKERQRRGFKSGFADRRPHHHACLAMPGHPKRTEIQSWRTSRWRVEGEGCHAQTLKSNWNGQLSVHPKRTKL